MSANHLVTAEELWNMPEVSGKRLELIDGELVKVPGAGALHTMIVFAPARLLEDFVRKHELGLVMPGGLAYVLHRNPDQIRIPDVSFIGWGSLPEDGIPEGFWEVPPTLAVEVVSPDDLAEDFHARVQDYLEAGSSQVWVLWPRRSSVSVYRPGADTRELGPDSLIDGGDILPGFSTQVSHLFDVQRRR